MLASSLKLCHNHAMNYQNILLTTDSGITTITLNRPDKRNALALDVLTELTDAFQKTATSNARGVILAANGPVFSAGHNFGDMAGATLEETRHVFQTCTDMMNAMQAMPQPLIAKVHALATAAGCQLVATCDLAIAADTASFAIPGGKAGLFCHALGGLGAQRRAQTCAGNGDDGRCHQCCHSGGLGVDQPRRTC